MELERDKRDRDAREREMRERELRELEIRDKARLHEIQHAAATAAALTPKGTLQVQELVVGASSMLLQDNNLSMVSGTSLTLAFAGGE